MTEVNALTEAQKALDELIEAAKTGAIIPVRLAGQLQAIAEHLSKAQDEQADAIAEAKKAANASPVDQEAFLKDQAFFVSHAIHELRTPMTNIRGYSDMLNSGAMGELNDMQKQFLETIRANSRRMEGLMVDVSDTSKIKGGTLRLSKKMDTFKNIAAMLEKNLLPQAEQQNKKLTFDIPNGLPLLDTDGEMLAKALTKLVENALRYSPEEGGEVTVKASADQNTLIVTITDNGIGMSPEDLAQLGTVYFRADTEAVRTHKGSGLGIPVAYGIIKALDGTINVESTLDKGTTFTITLKGMS